MSTSTRSSFRLTSRLALLASVIAVPLSSIIVWLIFQGIMPNIEFARSELAGNRYQRPLMAIQEALFRYEIARSHQAPDAKDIETEINRYFDQLDEAQKDLGERLAVTPSRLAEKKREGAAPASLRDTWQKVAAKESCTRADLTPLFNGIRTLITHIGDSSNLILDPDLDSYYLMDATLLALPQLQDSFADVSRIAADPSANPVDLKVAIAIIRQEHLPRVNGDVETCLAEDPHFYNALPSIAETLPGAAASLAVNTNLALQASPGALPAAIAKARDTALKAFNALSGQLDLLLEDRIHAYQRQLYRGLGAMVGVLLATALVGFWIRNNIASILRWVGKEMHDASVTTKETALAIQEISTAIANTASENAAALEETNATCHQMTSSAETSMKQMKETASIARQSRESSAQGVNELNELHGVLAELKAENESIDQILKAINEIAFQTNLLALNAAVEAARAGSAGAGFAVVADEVRALAKRSADSAKETSERLGKNKDKTNRSAEMAERLRDRLNRIAEHTHQMDQLSSKSAVAAEDQLSCIREMGNALDQLDQKTQEAAAKSEEAAASASEVNEQALELRKFVDELAHIVDGAAADKYLNEPTKKSASAGQPSHAETEAEVTLSH